MNTQFARVAPTGLAAYATRGTYKRPAHVALLEKRLLDVAAGRCRRLRVACPPRHGKSELVSRWFVAWWLMSNPTKRVILACATASLAESFSRKVRDLVVEHGHLFGAKLRPDSRAVDRWDLVQGGGLIAAGAGSSIVGRGGDLIVADDVISGFEIATSKTQLERLVTWFLRDVYTRLEPGGACVVTGTRWALLDLHGALEAEEKAGGEKWDSVVLPALSEGADVDPLGRPVGRALWPERYDEAELARIRSTLGSVGFAGLYAQKPVPEGGGLFQRSWARRWREDGAFVVFGEGGDRVARTSMERFLTVDTATTDASDRNAARNDFTAVGAWGVHGDRLVLLEVLLEKLGGAKIGKTIKAMSARHDGALPHIEENSTSKHFLSFLAAEGVLFKPAKCGGTKRSRAIPASALMEQGRVWLPERPGSHLDEFEHQVFSFTGEDSSVHDDAVDILSIATHIMSAPKGFTAVIDSWGGSSDAGGGSSDSGSHMADRWVLMCKARRASGRGLFF